MFPENKLTFSKEIYEHKQLRRLDSFKLVFLAYDNKQQCVYLYFVVIFVDWL